MYLAVDDTPSGAGRAARLPSLFPVRWTRSSERCHPLSHIVAWDLARRLGPPGGGKNEVLMYSASSRNSSCSRATKVCAPCNACGGCSRPAQSTMDAMGPASHGRTATGGHQPAASDAHQRPAAARGRHPAGGGSNSSSSRGRTIRHYTTTTMATTTTQHATRNKQRWPLPRPHAPRTTYLPACLPTTSHAWGGQAQASGVRGGGSPGGWAGDSWAWALLRQAEGVIQGGQSSSLLTDTPTPPNHVHPRPHRGSMLCVKPNTAGACTLPPPPPRPLQPARRENDSVRVRGRASFRPVALRRRLLSLSLVTLLSWLYCPHSRLLCEPQPWMGQARMRDLDLDGFGQAMPWPPLGVSLCRAQHHVDCVRGRTVQTHSTVLVCRTPSPPLHGEAAAATAAAAAGETMCVCARRKQGAQAEAQEAAWAGVGCRTVSSSAHWAVPVCSGLYRAGHLVAVPMASQVQQVRTAGSDSVTTRWLRFRQGRQRAIKRALRLEHGPSSDTDRRGRR